MISIDYYFAPQSPYSYLGHRRFVDIAERHGAAIRLLPCDMPKIFAASGGVVLAKRPVQRLKYRLADLRRTAALLGLPIVVEPQYFPVSGDAASRLVIATEFAHGLQAALAMTEAAMRAVWVEDRNISDDATLRGIADGLGHDGAALVAASHGDEPHKIYQANTERAITAQVFGAPSWEVNQELFWGQDRLDQLEAWLKQIKEQRGD